MEANKEAAIASEEARVVLKNGEEWTELTNI